MLKNLSSTTRKNFPSKTSTEQSAHWQSPRLPKSQDFVILPKQIRRPVALDLPVSCNTVQRPAAARRCGKGALRGVPQCYGAPRFARLSHLGLNGCSKTLQPVPRLISQGDSVDLR